MRTFLKFLEFRPRGGLFRVDVCFHLNDVVKFRESKRKRGKIKIKGTEGRGFHNLDFFS